MTAPLLQVEMLTKRFGGFVALDQVSLEVTGGSRLGLIGPNGSGKTTLINCVSGTLIHDDGRVVFKGADIGRLKAHERTRLGIARGFQIPRPFTSMTNLQNLMVPLEYTGRSGLPHAELAGEARRILGLVGLETKADDSCLDLTQIEMRKLELARALAAKPELLVADEVMAGLSNNEVDEILEILLSINQQGITIIMIEHIMRAVMGFSERVVVLDAGRLIADGAPDAVMRNPDVERAYLGD